MNGKAIKGNSPAVPAESGNGIQYSYEASHSDDFLHGLPGEFAQWNLGSNGIRPISPPDVPASVSRILQNKINILREAIREIESQIKKRSVLNRDFEKDINGEISECRRFLGGLPPPWSEGYRPKMEFLRSSLHKSLLTRKKDRRSETLKYWDDLVSLFKEKRKLLMEYQNIEMTREMLEKQEE